MRRFLPIFMRRKALLLLSLSTLALAGCGGGEEDSIDLTSYLPSFAAPAPVSLTIITQGFAGANNVTTTALNALLNTTRYQNTNATITWLQQNFDPNVPNNATQDPIRTSGAAFAHAAGLTGAGEFIVMSDSNVSFTHESLSGRVFIESVSSLSDEHGTAVASVMIGNSPNFVGVAPGASVYAGDFLNDTALANLGQWAVSIGAVAWNNSWGYTTVGLNQSGFNSAFNYGPGGLAYLAAIDAYANSGVVVFSVSNEVSESAGLMDGLPFLRNSLEAGWIAVANGVPTVAGNNVVDVHLLSNACWQAARWCIVADGSWNAATGGTNGYNFITGSSFAAPQVSGALALLAEAFPGLSPHQLRVRLLASAEDDFFTPDASVELATGFFKGYSVTYGHGFLDIEAALKPIGITTMALADGREISAGAPALLTGAAFGDSIERSLSGMNVEVRDALAAGFSMPADALTAAARPPSQDRALLVKSLLGDLAAERTADPTASASLFSAFAAPVMTMTAPDTGTTASVLVPLEGSESAGFSLTQPVVDGPTRVDLGLKLARDDGQMISLNGDSASMASVTLGITQDLGNGAYLTMSGEMGVSDLGGATALNRSSSARFDAVKLTAGQSDIFAKGDRLSVGVGMPVAIASGETVLDLPVIREGASAFESVAVDLVPDNRQVDTEVTYQTSLGDGVEMKFSVVHSDNYGNRTGLSDSAAVIGMKWSF